MQDATAPAWHTPCPDPSRLVAAPPAGDRTGRHHSRLVGSITISEDRQQRQRGVRLALIQAATQQLHQLRGRARRHHCRLVVVVM